MPFWRLQQPLQPLGQQAVAVLGTVARGEEVLGKHKGEMWLVPAQREHGGQPVGEECEQHMDPEIWMPGHKVCQEAWHRLAPRDAALTLFPDQIGPQARRQLLDQATAAPMLLDRGLARAEVARQLQTCSTCCLMVLRRLARSTAELIQEGIKEVGKRIQYFLVKFSLRQSSCRDVRTSAVTCVATMAGSATAAAT
eukprot:CAMPEP_0115322976 /NCGR_PEP_ID=MMETSP0270-20121206/81686_1 /TAXON_ID=71861 /ORGANISM="Scrippsiella trochoidea, Strain CCMP3099" /LENGTH=195 /DNA_ID=CAMNT_0002742971 /DNA_START=132 /DNA_END=717 /DNA_ORIENTATION=-